MQIFLRTFVIVMVAFINQSNAKEQRVIHVGEKAELFQQWEKVDDKYLLLKSAPIYQEAESETRSLGYFVPSSEFVIGQYSREIYDYDVHQSAVNIFQQIKKSLKVGGYQELFSCVTLACGDTAGWQLYLTPLIGGLAEKQYFLSAIKKTATAKPEYISVYITEIDDQPRALIDIVSLPTNNKFDIVVKTKQLLRTIEKDGRVVVDGITFDVGSSKLKHDSTRSIDLMSKILKKHPNFKFSIVGHTDNSGGFNQNIKLSIQRANAVKSVLIDKFGIAENQLIASGVGTLSPVTSNTDRNGRALNRRVELVKL